MNPTQKSRDRTFFDAFADAFTPPEDLDMHKPVHGVRGRLQDAKNIRKYFQKALAQEQENAKR